MAASEGVEFPSIQALQTAEQMELLDVVDSLRAHGLSEITALPQLIVCGDQSSGKSSVLEAISGIPFPRQENVCTRFATEVILRRAPTATISVSIVPSRDQQPTDRERLLNFKHELKVQDDFPDLFVKAKDCMGLSDPGEKSFSKDILRVEFCGPAQPQLTLVDLPGLIHSETRSQTADDIQLVTNLVADYLKNPRSIILAVVSAKNDIGNQIILRRAREVDPQGLRTLGIITKPDTLSKGSKAEEAFLALAKNEDVVFRLGWHVVKNLDSGVTNSQPTPPFNREEQEASYFKNSNFKSLPSHNIGIISLRTRLSKVLFHQIRSELPRLVKDIESRISSSKAIRDKLGCSRATILEQKTFLIELSQSFQSICRAAVRGDYDHAFFRIDENPERRLCANLMNKHFEFAENLRTKGALYKIVDIVNGIRDGRCITRDEAIQKACKLLKRSRGRELPGLPNPLLVGELFREYSRPWESLARSHIKNVWDAAYRFVELVLQHLTDEVSCEKILRFALNPIMSKKLESAYAKLDELLEVHKEHPLTTNHYFMDNRKKLQQKTGKEEIEERLKKEFAQPNQKLTVDDISRIVAAVSPNVNPDMDLVAAEDAFENMNAYYKVAMKLFMDNVPTLAIQAPIVRKLDEIMCPTSVFRMDAEIITSIAGESEEKVHDREEVISKLAVLEAGARICKQYALRHSDLAGRDEGLRPRDQKSLPRVDAEREREDCQSLSESGSEPSEGSFSLRSFSISTATPTTDTQTHPSPFQIPALSTTPVGSTSWSSNSTVTKNNKPPVAVSNASLSESTCAKPFTHFPPLDHSKISTSTNLFNFISSPTLLQGNTATASHQPTATTSKSKSNLAPSSPKPAPHRPKSSAATSTTRSNGVTFGSIAPSPVNSFSNNYADAGSSDTPSKRPNDLAYIPESPSLHS